MCARACERQTQYGIVLNSGFMNLSSYSPMKCEYVTNHFTLIIDLLSNVNMFCHRFSRVCGC